MAGLPTGGAHAAAVSTMQRSSWHPTSQSVAAIARFGVLALIPVVGLGLVLANQLQQSVERQALAAAERSGALVTRVGVQPLLLPEDLRDGVTPARRATLDAALAGGQVNRDVARIKVWNQQGIVVYSDNASLIGRHQAVDDDLRRALQGTTSASLTQPSDAERAGDTLTGTLVQVYSPLVLAGAGSPSGAFEVYLPYGPVQETVRTETDHLWLVLALGLALLYALMFPAVLAAERWRLRADSARALAGDERRRRDEAERLSELKSSFLATMSHELRTPLNSILGFAQLLRMQVYGNLGDRQLHYVDNIESSGQHLLALVNDVLDLAKIEAGRLDMEMETVDVAGVLGSVEELLQGAAAARQVTLRVPTPRGLLVLADRRRLTQVLVNVVSNAIKFTPPGGMVELSTAPGGAHACLEVADTGPGIASEEQALIFEEFRQSASGRGSGGGTGLGLPISRRLMQLMGGDLVLAGSSPAGTIFRLSMATAAAPALARQAS